MHRHVEKGAEEEPLATGHQGWLSPLEVGKVRALSQLLTVPKAALQGEGVRTVATSSHLGHLRCVELTFTSSPASIYWKAKSAL